MSTNDAVSRRTFLTRGSIGAASLALAPQLAWPASEKMDAARTNDSETAAPKIDSDPDVKRGDRMEFVFTNDDAGGGDEAKRPVACFKKIIELLDVQDIKGTFFWMPRARSAGWIPGYERKEWTDILHWTLKRGHDVQLHVSLGYLLGYATTDKVEREKFGKWRVQDRLKDSIDIYGKVFGEEPVLLRPHGDFRFYDFPSNYETNVEKLFAPLVGLGIRHISLPLSMSLKAFHVGQSEAGYRFPFRHASGMVGYPWVVEDCTPRPAKKLEDSPGAGEPQIAFDQWLAMAQKAFDCHRKENTGVGLMNSHWHAMCRDWSQTERFYNLLFAYIKKNGCRFKTLKEEIKSD